MSYGEIPLSHRGDPELMGEINDEDNLTGDLSSVEYVRHVRNGDPDPDLLGALAAAAARAERAEAALADLVACTTTRSGTRRPMIADGKGRQFAAAIMHALEILAADQPAPSRAAHADGGEAESDA